MKREFRQSGHIESNTGEPRQRTIEILPSGVGDFPVFIVKAFKKSCLYCWSIHEVLSLLLEHS